MKCDACPVHPVGFMDLSYGVKFEARKHFTRAGAISTGEGCAKGLPGIGQTGTPSEECHPEPKGGIFSIIEF